MPTLTEGLSSRSKAAEEDGAAEASDAFFSEAGLSFASVLVPTSVPPPTPVGINTSFGALPTISPTSPGLAAVS